MAPVTVGNGVTIAAGTTVTRNIADNELVLSRVPQVHKQGWQRPVKKNKQDCRRGENARRTVMRVNIDPRPQAVP